MIRWHPWIVRPILAAMGGALIEYLIPPFKAGWEDVLIFAGSFAGLIVVLDLVFVGLGRFTKRFAKPSSE